jgi:hypothetical protein
MDASQEIPSFLVAAVILAPFTLIFLLYLLQRAAVQQTRTAIKSETKVTEAGHVVGVCTIVGSLADGNLDIVTSHIKRCMVGHDCVLFDFTAVDSIDDPEESLLWLRQLSPHKKVALAAHADMRVLFELLDLTSKYPVERTVEKALNRFDNWC